MQCMICLYKERYFDVWVLVFNAKLLQGKRVLMYICFGDYYNALGATKHDRPPASVEVPYRLYSAQLLHQP